MTAFSQKAALRRGTAFLALVLGSSIAVSPQAGAQEAQTTTDIEQAQAAAADQGQPASADAQESADDSSDKVIITGSLIRGTEAVGTPIFEVGAETFEETAAITLSDALRDVPAIMLLGNSGVTQNTANTSHSQPVNIHGLNGGFTRRTALLVDGLRMPPQNQDQAFYDPSMIPTLAVGNVDVLADGASAIYGSDAVAGVINVHLKRKFDGAESQFKMQTIDRQGGFTLSAAHIMGKTWEGGGATFTYEHSDQPPLAASKRPLNTFDFTPWGLDNRTPVNSATPAIVSVGANPSPATGTTCGNCFSTPAGTDGRNLTWAQFLANPGTANQQDPYSFGGALIYGQIRNAAVLTFDQELLPNVRLVGEAFWSARRSKGVQPNVSLALSSWLTVPVPTSNPYYPVGAPTGLRAAFTVVDEIKPTLSTLTEVARVAGGFEVDLPFEWQGRLTAAYTHDLDTAKLHNLVNVNNVSAALGNTVNVAASPGFNTPYTFTKPANVPYLNPFCDMRAVEGCIDPLTANYITAYRDDYSKWVTNEFSATFDGPLFELPGGPVKAAVGASYVEERVDYVRTTNQSTPSTAIVVSSPSPGERNVWASYAQLNIPLVGSGNALPLIESLVLEAAIRHDEYDMWGGTTNPKVGLDWTPFDGLTVHGSWGTSFIAPSFAQEGVNTGVTTKGIFIAQNIAAGNASNGTPVCTTVGGTPAPGSAAALLNPSCSAALQFPGGINVGSSAAVPVSVGLEPPGYTLGPETSENLNIGFEYAPYGNFLEGLTIGATYWHVKIDDVISSGCGALNNPACSPYIATDVGTPNFQQILAAVLANPANVVPPTIPSSNIRFLVNTGNINLGSLDASGVDLSARYERDFGALGTWETGLVGAVYLKRDTWNGLGTDPSNYQDPLKGENLIAGLGNPTAHRFMARGNVGWSKGAFDVKAFVNYVDEYYATDQFPASYLVTHPDANRIPVYYTYDLSIRFSPGEMFDADYLQDLSVSLVINNVTDKDPPFQYNTSSSAARGGITAYDPSQSPLGRMISLQFSKKW